MMLPIKTITSVLKVLTYIITNFTAHPKGLAVILVVMSVLTFTTDVILYILLRGVPDKNVSGGECVCVGWHFYQRPTTHVICIVKNKNCEHITHYEK